MPVEQPVTATNDAPDKVVRVTCNCDFLWSLATQFSYLRLSDETGPSEYKLVDLYAARARRIAATYARFYLETEQGGDPSKVGRYYWMALGAFASKTVSCLLDAWQLQASYALFMKAIANGLAQGNLWLFVDISASHWFYNNYREHFHAGMACERERDSRRLEGGVARVVAQLPWSEPSLPRIAHFVPSADIVEGFQWVRRIEDAVSAADIPAMQLEQLVAIANHEQGAVLQPLIYDDPVFSRWTARERRWFRWLAPTYQLSFSHRCEVEQDHLRSVAPDEMVVEDFESRMSWILSAAERFHGLMLDNHEYMVEQLQTIAGWVESPDAAVVY